MIVRYETWGAWVRLESRAAVIAIDRDGARILGLASAKWSDPPQPSMPLEVHLAVTSRCGAGCHGCYLDAKPQGDEPTRSEIEARLDALRDAGVFTVAFGGGEPTLRDDLGDLADAARARGLSPVVTTSGLGLSPRKIMHLTRFAQVNVSYDGDAVAYESVRGFDGSRRAEEAITALAEAGVTVGANVVLTRATFACLRTTLTRARAAGASEAQLLRYKPQGRARSVDYLTRRLTPEQGRSLGPLLRELTGEVGLTLRVDCALVPYFSADPSFVPAELARWGVLGCEAASYLAAVRTDGRVAPCSFAGASDVRIDQLAERWPDDPTLTAFRTAPASEPCASCTLSAVCRGGCKIVSGYLEGRPGPDPECPRVLAS